MGKSVTTEGNFRWLRVTGVPGVVAEYWPNSKDGRCESEGIARSFDHHGGTVKDTDMNQLGWALKLTRGTGPHLPSTEKVS